LQESPAKLQAMSRQARLLARLDAASAVADLCLKQVRP